MTLRPGGVALRVDSLTVEASEDGRVIVDGVSLEIRTGETLCLAGESGSGKSMTARALMSLCPRELRASYRALVVAGDEKAPAYRMALVPQRALSALNPLLRIRTQMIEAFVARGFGNATDGEERAVHLLGEVGIDAPERRIRQYPHQLSGGQSQRVLIAMALMCRPAVLIADEPTTALDPSTQVQVLKLLKQLARSEGLGLLVITHDLAVAAAAADRLAIMYAGQIVEEGPARDVLAAPAHPYSRALLACTPDIGTGQFGQLPSPIPGIVLPRGRHASGCAFANRCSLAGSDCRRDSIALAGRPGDRRVRCVLS